MMNLFEAEGLTVGRMRHGGRDRCELHRETLRRRGAQPVTGTVLVDG
jgi:hypothetical protein